MKYKRILLKLSGETLSGENEKGINNDILIKTVAEIKKIYDLGVEIAIVIGGGNFWRGKLSKEMDRVTADYIGMLGTTMNALALHDALLNLDIESVVSTAIEMRPIGSLFNAETVKKDLDNGKIVIFAGGIGHPYFSTDTGAALRAIEINADIIIKATKVDGIYTKDPKKYDDAIRYSEITYEEILEKQLGIMDLTAINLCLENRIPLAVLNFYQENSLLKFINDPSIGTIVK